MLQNAIPNRSPDQKKLLAALEAPFFAALSSFSTVVFRRIGQPNPPDCLLGRASAAVSLSLERPAFGAAGSALLGPGKPIKL
jgi:hypothetical protein